MTHEDMIRRLEMMARCDGKQDLSPNDCKAIAYVLKWTKNLQMVCENRGRREQELRAELTGVRTKLFALDKQVLEAESPGELYDVVRDTLAGIFVADSVLDKSAS